MIPLSFELMFNRLFIVKKRCPISKGERMCRFLLILLKSVVLLTIVMFTVLRVTLACVASVSVLFRSKERPRNEILGFGRARNETRGKK